MKKMVMMLIAVMTMMAVMVSAFAEPAETWFEATEVLEKYANENNLILWKEDYYDDETKTRFDLLTIDKDYLLSTYGFDFDKKSSSDFEKWYEELFYEMYPDSKVTIMFKPVDIYDDTMIYELMIATDIDMEPDNKELVNCGRAFCVAY